jgi:hypothetical protein
MNWHYVYGAVWNTPLGPEDGGQCVAMRASKSNLEPIEKDAALRLMAAAPDLLAALQSVVDRYAPTASPANDAVATMWKNARAAIARSTSKD